MNKLSESPFQDAKRNTVVSFKWPVFEIDTVTYDLPEGFTLEKIPAKVTLTSDFGYYTTEVTKTGSRLQYIRTFKVFKAEHPIDRYDEIVAFFEKIVTADENKVMLTQGDVRHRSLSTLQLVRINQLHEATSGSYQVISYICAELLQFR